MKNQSEKYEAQNKVLEAAMSLAGGIRQFVVVPVSSLIKETGAEALREAELEAARRSVETDEPHAICFAVVVAETVTTLRSAEEWLERHKEDE